MTLEWSDPTFLHGAAMLMQFVHVGQGYLGATSGWFGLAPKRMEIAALHPVLGFAALVISAVIRWWLMEEHRDTIHISLGVSHSQKALTN